ncbi:hypothetical protein Lal_00001370 [Lupinus albus]|nr:hypothetical protein Lal_00001370 [Lupinus albus]
MSFILPSNSSNPTLDLSRDLTSPYYLHPLENPSNALVSHLLNGENYHKWCRSMKMSLISKQKLGFVDDIKQAPLKTGAIYKVWKRANIIEISWITRSVTPSIAQSILWIDKAHEIWDELNERISQGNLFRIVDLQESIAKFR